MEPTTRQELTFRPTGVEKEHVVESGLISILVVEDDQGIQGMMEEALAGGGFEATLAASGEEALRILRDDTYQALVTDINLAGELTGWDVARRARELKHDIAVVYMTGAAADQWSAQGVPDSILLNKPFAPAQVVTAVAQLLNQTPPAYPA